MVGVERAVGWRTLRWEAVRQVWCGARVVWGETVGKGGRWRRESRRK